MLTLENLRLPLIDMPIPKKQNRLPRHKAGEPFLKGPIPLDWLATAARLPGKALCVGLAIWYLGGMGKGQPTTLTGKTLRKFGVSRKAASRCLSSLESVGLVQVERHPGRCPVVTLCDAPPSRATSQQNIDSCETLSATVANGSLNDSPAPVTMTTRKVDRPVQSDSSLTNNISETTPCSVD